MGQRHTSFKDKDNVKVHLQEGAICKDLQFATKLLQTTRCTSTTAESDSLQL